MSEKKLDTILQKLEKMESAQQRHGDHIHQLLQIVGATNASISHEADIAELRRIK